MKESTSRNDADRVMVLGGHPQIVATTWRHPGVSSSWNIGCSRRSRANSSSGKPLRDNENSEQIN